jgi:hypothetical protein
MSTVARYIPADREGYFMNADDQRTAEALLRMEPDETAKRLAILKDMANGIADDLEARAKKLKTCPGDAEFQSNGLVLAQ